MKDRKLRLEDAVNATKAAVEEGIVPGGGTTLAHISEELLEWAKDNLLEDELIAEDLLTFHQPVLYLQVTLQLLV